MQKPHANDQDGERGSSALLRRGSPGRRIFGAIGGLALAAALASGAYSSYEKLVVDAPVLTVNGTGYSKDYIMDNELPPSVILGNARQLAGKPWAPEAIIGAMDRDPDYAFRHAYDYVGLLGPKVARDALVSLAGQNDSAIRDYEHYSRLPYSREMLEASIKGASGNPKPLIRYANVYRFLPDASQILGEAIQQARSLGQMNLLLEYADSISGYPGMEGKIKEVAIQELNNGQDLLFLYSMPSYPEHPWVLGLAAQVANRNPLMFLPFADKIKSFPDADGIMQGLFSKFGPETYYVNQNYNIIIGAFPKYSRYPGADPVMILALQKALDLNGEESILEHSGSFSMYPWGEYYVSSAAAKDPSGAIRYLKGYIGNSWAEPVFRTALDSELDSRNGRIVLDHSEELLHFGWGGSYIERAAKIDSTAAIKDYTRYLGYANHEAVLEGAVARSVKDYPAVVLDNAIKFAGRPWGVGYINEAAHADPDEALRAATASRFYLLDKAYLATIRDAAKRASPGALLANIRVCKYAVSEDELSRLVRNAIYRYPAGGLSNYSSYSYMNGSAEWFLKAAQKLEESDPLGVLGLEVSERLMRMPGGIATINRAAENDRLSDTGALLWRFWIWNSLWNRQQLIENAVFNNPMDAVSILEQGNTEQSAALRSIIGKSLSPNIRALLTINFGDTAGSYWDTHRKAALLLVNNPNQSYEDVVDTINDSNRFFSALMNLRYRPDAYGRGAINGLLANQALKKIDVLNSMHEKPGSIRFASVDNASARELYTLMVYGDSEEYTSTYDGLFKRFAAALKKENITPREFMEGIGYDNFREFIMLASQYGRLRDFLAMSGPSFNQQLLQRFVKNIDKEKNMLNEAVAVADTFAAVSDPKILSILQDTVKSEYERVDRSDNKQARIVYGLLAGMFGNDAVVDQQWLSDISKEYNMPNAMFIPSGELFNSDGTDVQEYFFYPDADGKASFADFLAQYRDRREWSIADDGRYIILSSRGGPRRIEIFANKPESGEDGITDMERAMGEQGLSAEVVVHRGHSYYADITISHIPKTARIVSLGSCGGYNNVAAVLAKAPDASIISTKGLGTMLVNDPLDKMLNDYILSGRDINWQKFWDEAQKELGRNPNFKYYTPPYKNLSMLFYKAYNRLMGDSAAPSDGSPYNN